MVVLAIVVFAVSCIDRIELVGRYKIVEMNGMNLEEMLAESGEAGSAKVYMDFGFFGDVKLTAKVDDGVEGKEWIEGYFESFNEDSPKWSVKGGEMFMTEDGEEVDQDYGQEYELGLLKLEIGEDKEIGSFERAGIMGYLCPSIIMKALSVIILAIGIILFFTKGNSAGTPAYSYATVMPSMETSGANRCSNCGSPINPDDMFCENCGTPVGVVAGASAAAPASAPVTPASTPICMSCGGSIKAGDMFCEHCGAPVGGASTPAAKKAPAVAPAVAPTEYCINCGNVVSPTDKFCQSCGAVLDVYEPAPAPATPVASAYTSAPEVAPAASAGLKSTFRAKPDYEVEENNGAWFQSAGDL